MTCPWLSDYRAIFAKDTIRELGFGFAFPTHSRKTTTQFHNWTFSNKKPLTNEAISGETRTLNPHRQQLLDRVQMHPLLKFLSQTTLKPWSIRCIKGTWERTRTARGLRSLQRGEDDANYTTGKMESLGEKKQTVKTVKWCKSSYTI